jgi:hypothetical protein
MGRCPAQNRTTAHTTLWWIDGPEYLIKLRFWVPTG